MSETKLVRAKELGFYRNGMVAPGTVFRVPTTFKAKWVVDAESPVEAKKATVEEEPTTLSEMGRKGRRKPIGVQPLEPLETK